MPPAGGRKTKKLWLVRKDEAAVTPVIATILLVAMTMVLVSTLYVMVTALLPKSAAGENTVDIVTSDNQDGNWTLIVSSIDTQGVPADSVKLTIYDQNAVIKLNRVPLSYLTWLNATTYKAVYYDVLVDGKPGLSAGDSIIIFKRAEHEPIGIQKPAGGYDPGNSYSLTYGSTLLASGRL